MEDSCDEALRARDWAGGRDPNYGGGVCKLIPRS